MFIEIPLVYSAVENRALSLHFKEWLRNRKEAKSDSRPSAKSNPHLFDHIDTHLGNDLHSKTPFGGAVHPVFGGRGMEGLYCIANRTAIPPQVAPTMKDAVSYLAKLGGFLGRKGDGEPGVKVI